ncbi:MAG: hypothetical protein HOV87_02120 [Catenulispora sp.]|nr:hypothetical protein [Catenulispora sp.]
MTEPLIGLSSAEEDDVEEVRPAATFDSTGRLAVSWLWDSGDRQVLLLTAPDDGETGDGSTLLAATLAELSPEMPERSRLHAQASARGLNPRVLTWILAAQLDLCADSPADLARQLAADPRPVTLLVAELDASGPGQLGWETRPIVDELLRPLLKVPGLRLVVQTSHSGLFGTDADVLAVPAYPGIDPDPHARLAVLGTTTVQDALMGGWLVDLCANPHIAAEANPTTLAVAATTVLNHLPGAVQTQIETFGQGLITTEPPSSYLLHHAAAVATADEELQKALEPHIAHLPMRAAWARWRPEPGLVTPDWPGAVSHLAPSADDPHTFLMTDRSGRTHVLDLTAGTELGRIPGPRTQSDTPSTAQPKTTAQGPWYASASPNGNLTVRRDGFQGDVLNVNLGWKPTALLLTDDGTLIVGGRHGLLCFRPTGSN